MKFKVRKLIITGILIILSILAINTKVEARSLIGLGNTITAAARGAPVDISNATVIDGEPGNNTFCVYVREDLIPNSQYNVVNYIHIDGLNSYIYENNQGRLLATHTTPANGTMAWILAQVDEGGFPYKREYSNKQNAVYGYSATWFNANALVFKNRNTAGGVTYTNQDWISKGNDYANAYAQAGNAKITNNKQGEVGIDTYVDNAQEYIKVGPLNWSMTGKISAVNVYDQNNNTIPIKYGKYSGTNFEISDSKDIIQNGQDFYILIKNDGNIEEISKIDAQVTAQKENIKADIWTLSRNGGIDNQNLITTDAKVETETTTANLTIGKIGLTGDLEVVKVNKDNTSIKLEGVGFIIKRANSNKYVKQTNGKITYVENKTDATEFVTDKDGKIKIEKLVVGDYIAYETKNANYGYEILKDGIPLKVVVNKKDPTQIGNKQVLVKLSGYVWEDILFGKTSKRNDLFKDNDYDINDNLMKDITVRLKDKSGNIVKNKDGKDQILKTGEKGEYQFVDVLIDQLTNYVVEFEYDGLVYTNVIVHNEVDNGSKSAESIAGRNDFNMKFSSVENKAENLGQTRDDKNNIAHDNLNYIKNSEEYKSTLDHKRSVYNITANTNEAGYNIREHFKYGMEEIKHINLGLYGREQPDLAVIKDVQNAIVTINGYEHTYNYADRFSDQEYEKGFNMGIKFKNERGTQAYTRAIYKSDVTYVGNPERELKVKVTYKIRVINESTDLKTKVNSIVDYYDSGYTISAIGTGVNAQGNITGELKHQDGGYNEKYKKTVINTSDIIEPQNFTDVYVQFSMDRTTILNIMNKKEPLDNITEINSYSVFDKDGKVYAGIDKDSAPGNTIPGNVSTYEDDTDKAPAFILEPKDDREMGGTIFEDNAISSGVGKIREGNGLLNEGEHGIEDVEVTLKETSGAGVADKTVKTDVNGNFIFAAYIPGDYIITYTWGGQTYTEQGTSNVTTYTVQNYKGTVFNQEAHKGVEWYKQLEPRYTDATDNYNKDEQAPKGSRQQIDNEMKDVTYANKTKYTYKKLDSTTPKMGFGVEYDSLISDSAEDKFVYKVNNIDFGLIKRATQSIQMNKSVDTIKVTFANGTIMADAKIVEDKDGKKYLEGNKSGMTYMEPSSTTVPSNGFIKIELDNELLQGSTLELSYKLKTTNISELDYLSEEFYKYGTIQGNIVTITPSKIIDYLDKDWGYDQEKNKEGGWIEKTLDEIKQMQQNGMFGEAVYGNESDIQNTRILYTEKLKEAKIEPTKSESVMLNVSKILTTSDAIELNNETEIIETNKDGGGETPEIPGNHIPGKTPEEPDTSTAETVIVTPPTGNGNMTAIYIAAGVIALIILGVGVIVIKKKALK